MSALIRFKVSAPSPHDHLLHIRLEVDAVGDVEHVDLSMPVWSPGSYLVREYARHVQNLRAFDAEGDRRRVRKIDKATWRVDAANRNSIAVEYQVFAHDLNVRGNHVDETHAFFTGVATYLYPKGREQEAIELEVVPPDASWQVYTGLEDLGESQRRFVAPNFDVFFDCPVEMGAHLPIEFEVEGKVHRMIFWGDSNLDRDQLAADVPRIIEANRDVFGELPYEDYLFITLVSEAGGGGLEHLNSTALMYPRHNFRPSDKPGDIDDGYLNFLRLICHEHFHAWNVKRIRPAALGPFEYQHENYTRDLWTVEGVTSYYDTLGLLRAGFIDANGYLQRFLKAVHRLDRVPGRQLQSLEDASFDAWIKLYRPDEHTLNSTVSYYLKGELVCALLDVKLRAETGGEKSLDSVLRHLWEHYFQADGSGYPEGGYEQIIEELCDVGMGEFFDAYIRGVDEIDWNGLLEPMGLEFERKSSAADKAWFGADTAVRDGRLCVKSVPTGCPAHAGGIYAGDEIVAVDGWKVTGENFSKLLADKSPGQAVEVHLFRRGELRECTVELGLTPPDTYCIRTRDDASESARALLRGWLGSDDIAAEFTG
jgi:predicted metalloprotease with PDZ domain